MASLPVAPQGILAPPLLDATIGGPRHVRHGERHTLEVTGDLRRRVGLGDSEASSDAGENRQSEHDPTRSTAGAGSNSCDRVHFCIPWVSVSLTHTELPRVSRRALK